MALDFPDTPTVGDMYGSLGTMWRWSGTMWESTSGASGPRGAVAYAQITAAQGGITALTDITDLRVTFQANPARTYRISGHGEVYSTVSNDIPICNIADGTSGAAIARTTDLLGGAGYSIALDPVVIERGLSGAQIRKLQVQRVLGTGTLTFHATSTGPAYILVEDITYEAGTSGVGIEPSAWTVATMGAGWTHYTNGRSQTAYRKVGDQVQLRVSASGGGTAAVGSTMFTLPSGYWPPGVLDVWGRDGGSTGTAVLYNITAAGLVQWYGSTPANNSVLCCFLCQFSVTP